MSKSQTLFRLIPTLLFLISVFSACDRKEIVPPGELTQRQSLPPEGIAYTFAKFTIGNKAYAGLSQQVGGPIDSAWYEYDPQIDQWTKKSPLPDLKRSGTISFTVGGKGYVGGGSYHISIRQFTSYYQDLWQYNPETDQWLKRKPLPVRNDSLNAMQAVSLGEHGYLLEIRENAGNLWRYDADQDQWQSLSSMPTAAFDNSKPLHLHNAYITFFVIDLKAYCLFQSYDGSTGATQLTLWEYTPQADTWQKAAAPVARDFLFAINGKGYFVTTQDESSAQQYHLVIWEYDPSKGTSTKKNSINVTRSYGPGIGFAIGDTGYFGVDYRWLTKSFWAFKP